MRLSDTIPTLGQIPETVNLAIYAGDTFNMSMTTPFDWSTYTWTGQIRQTIGGTVDGTFTFLPLSEVTGETDFGMVAMLSADDTRALATAYTTDDTDTTNYDGYYDVQVSFQDENGFDVVRTLVAGKVVVVSDVTA